MENLLSYSRFHYTTYKFHRLLPILAISLSVSSMKDSFSQPGEIENVFKKKKRQKCCKNCVSEVVKIKKIPIFPSISRELTSIFQIPLYHIFQSINVSVHRLFHPVQFSTISFITKARKSIDEGRKPYFFFFFS